MVSNLRCRIKENTIPVQSNTKIVPVRCRDFFIGQKEKSEESDYSK